MRLVVVGNCQARPIAARLATARGVVMDEPIILHLARKEDESAHSEALGGADLILAQSTAAGFTPQHLASEALCAAYAGRVVVWPNFFYAGQQPFLRYLTHREAGRLAGPFDVYHDLRLLASWRAGQGLGSVPTRETEMQFADEVAQASLAELRAREACCDVPVADLVEESAGSRRCFFTFNHPAGWLLDRVAERLGSYIGAPPLHRAPEGWEPLGRIVPPGEVLTEEHYSTASKVYDRAAQLLNDPHSLRTTPAFKGDAAWLGEVDLVTSCHA